MSRVLNLLTTARPHHATRAIVLYEAEGSAFATVHPIERTGEQWRVGPGQPLGRDGLAEALQRLAGASHRREILPEHVLYADAGRILWFRPAGVRPIFFHTGKAEFDEAMRGAQALYPALLFLATPGRLYVWALGDDARPTGSTPLHQAPFLNIYDSGLLCSGNTKLPLEVRLDVAPWERAFYETTFTHSNVRDRLTGHPGGHDGLWRELVKPPKRFPAKWLRPLRGANRAATVADALNLEITQ